MVAVAIRAVMMEVMKAADGAVATVVVKVEAMVATTVAAMAVAAMVVVSLAA